MASKTISATAYSPVKTGNEEARPSQVQFDEHASWISRHHSLLWMLAGFVSGLSFAIGHHLFYASFDNVQVDTASMDQNWIVRIGTAFAFVTKAAFVVSTSLAYVQYQWLMTRSQDFRLKQLDEITGVLGNALCFIRTRIWLRLPILTVLAGITWLLPLAAVTTPATITVSASQQTSSVSESPPRPYYNPLTYGAPLDGGLHFMGASWDMLRVAYSTATTGQILTLPMDHPNASYTLKFTAPALSCDPADEALVRDTVYAYYNMTVNATRLWDGGFYYFYVAWVPDLGAQPDGTVEPGASVNITNSMLEENCPTLDTVSTDAAHLYVIPDSSNLSAWSVNYTYNPADHYGYQDLLDCKLYNASYTLSLNFSYPAQSITVQHRELLNPVTGGFWSFMDYGVDPSNVTYHEAADGLKTIYQQFCYMGVMDAFGQLLVGYIVAQGGLLSTKHTSAPLTSVDWTTRNSTQAGLEELFQNITLSMLSFPSLTTVSSIFDQVQMPITVLSIINIYHYDAGALWLAYGIAASATLLCMMLGIYATWRNGACYQNNLSTFIRTTTSRHGILLGVVGKDTGAEPLPKQLAERKIRLAAG